MMKALKIAGWILLVIVGVVVVGLAITKVYMDATYFSGYDQTAPLDAQLAGTEDRPSYVRQLVYFNGWRNDRVSAFMFVPKNAPGPVPCVIFLHGIGQDKDFSDEDVSKGVQPPPPFQRISEPFLAQGFAFVSFDQYMRGERRLPKGTSLLKEANAFRLRPAYTVNDTRRLIDYLETRPDIDKNRIYLAGASYGAITGSTATAFDKRIKAAVLCYGGGNVPRMLEARAVAEEMSKRGVPMLPVQLLAWYILGAADPVKYADKIAPRPVFLQNGTDDCLISTPASKALQSAVKEPKEIKIYEGDHIGMDANTLIRVLNDIVGWLKQQDNKLIAGSGSQTAAQTVKPAA